MRTFEEILADVDQAFATNDSEALLRYAIELDEVSTPTAEATAHNARGAAHRMRADYVLAMEHYHRSLALFDELDDRNRVAHVLLGIGIVHVALGDYPAGLEHYHRSLAIYEELDVRSGAAGVTGNIGVVHFETGDYPAALEHFHRALQLHDELGGQFGAAIATGNIGNVHLATGNISAALEHYNRALQLHEELGDRSSVATVTDNIGLLHSQTGNYSVALEHFQRALTLCKEIGDRSGVAHATGNMLNTYLELGLDSEATSLLATMDAMQLDEPSLRTELEQNRAALQERSGDIHGAVESLQRALSEALEFGMRLQAANTHKRLRNIAQKRNDLAAYVEHNNEFTRITEEINGKDTSTKLAMQEAERRIAAERERERTERERERTERERERAVLYSTLPKHIADRVIRGEVVNDHIDDAAVMFVDIVGFTAITSTLTSQHVVTLLDAVFKICDEKCKQHNVTRIKTIGDSYLAVAMPFQMPDAERQMPDQMPNQFVAIANAALKIIEQVKELDFKSLLSLQVPSISSSDSKRLQVPSISSSDSKRLQVPSISSSDSESLQVRIGLHRGPVTAGVLGTERLQYDVWGDTVNVASRMESTSEPNRIHVSSSFALALQGDEVTGRQGENEFEIRNMEHGTRNHSAPGTWRLAQENGTWHLALRGETEIKGKGPLTTYWLEG